MDLSNENVIHVEKEGIQYLQFRKLLKYSDIITHGYSLGIDKNFRTARANKQKLPEQEAKKAIKDYENLGKCIDIKLNKMVKPNQAHTDKIQIVEKHILENEPDFNLEVYDKTDGLITNKKDIALATTNADCILLLFFDPVNKVIANVHSGWRGTIQRISVKTVQKMVDKFNCKPENIICCICPSIRKCHFEVENDVKEIFEKEFKDLKIEQNNDIMEKQKDKEKWNIDTVLINKILLKQEGLKQENIIDSGICSVCNSDLIHSYRVEKQGYGLATALIKINDKGL
ncbi:MAG: peptidoglycan editing factor PgeF [Clostridiales bacterium]|nr:peptidoglycan editing factor PgeF [Clostridiales bacterium]